MTNRKTYYLWGLFTLEDTEYLKSAKDKVQSRLISPYFVLYLTFSGLFLEIDKTFICKLRSFRENNSSIILQVDGYCFKRELFKSFYLSIKIHYL